MPRSSDDVISRIVREAKAKAAPAGMRTKVIAVDGAGGAGKTTLANRVAEELGGAQVVRTDDFASWDNPLNWWPRLIGDVLEPLTGNRPALPTLGLGRRAEGGVA